MRKKVLEYIVYISIKIIIYNIVSSSRMYIERYLLIILENLRLKICIHLNIDKSLHG